MKFLQFGILFCLVELSASLKCYTCLTDCGPNSVPKFASNCVQCAVHGFKAHKNKITAECLKKKNPKTEDVPCVTFLDHNEEVKTVCTCETDNCNRFDVCHDMEHETIDALIKSKAEGLDEIGKTIGEAILNGDILEGAKKSVAQLTKHAQDTLCNERIMKELKNAARQIDLENMIPELKEQICSKGYARNLSSLMDGIEQYSSTMNEVRRIHEIVSMVIKTSAKFIGLDIEEMIKFSKNTELQGLLDKIVHDIMGKLGPISHGLAIISSKFGELTDVGDIAQFEKELMELLAMLKMDFKGDAKEVRWIHAFIKDIYTTICEMTMTGHMRESVIHVNGSHNMMNTTERYDYCGEGFKGVADDFNKQLWIIADMFESVKSNMNDTQRISQIFQIQSIEFMKSYGYGGEDQGKIVMDTFNKTAIKVFHDRKTLYDVMKMAKQTEKITETVDTLMGDLAKLLNFDINMPKLEEVVNKTNLHIATVSLHKLGQQMKEFLTNVKHLSNSSNFKQLVREVTEMNANSLIYLANLNHKNEYAELNALHNLSVEIIETELFQDVLADMMKLIGARLDAKSALMMVNMGKMEWQKSLDIRVNETMMAGSELRKLLKGDALTGALVSAVTDVTKEVWGMTEQALNFVIYMATVTKKSGNSSMGGMESLEFLKIENLLSLIHNMGEIMGDLENKNTTIGQAMNKMNIAALQWNKGVDDEIKKATKLFEEQINALKSIIEGQEAGKLMKHTMNLFQDMTAGLADAADGKGAEEILQKVQVLMEGLLSPKGNEIEFYHNSMNILLALSQDYAEQIFSINATVHRLNYMIDSIKKIMNGEEVSNAAGILRDIELLVRRWIAEVPADMMVDLNLALGILNDVSKMWAELWKDDRVNKAFRLLEQMGLKEATQMKRTLKWVMIDLKNMVKQLNQMSRQNACLMNINGGIPVIEDMNRTGELMLNFTETHICANVVKGNVTAAMELMPTFTESVAKDALKIMNENMEKLTAMLKMVPMIFQSNPNKSRRNKRSADDGCAYSNENIKEKMPKGVVNDEKIQTKKSSPTNDAQPTRQRTPDNATDAMNKNKNITIEITMILTLFVVYYYM